MHRTLTCLGLAALALAACTPDFEPASRVDRLRVLAIRADPPEIQPAGPAAQAPARAELTALVLRPEVAGAPGPSTVVVYLACLPAPGDPAPTPCAALAGLRDPTALVAQAAQAACSGAAPGAISLAGIERCGASGCEAVTLASGGAPVVLPRPALDLPAGWDLASLPPGAPERILGVQAEVLAFALDAAPGELEPGSPGACPLADAAAAAARLWPAREHVLATKRVRVRGPEAVDPPNRNPALAGIAADGVPLASASPPSSLGAGERQLRPVLPADGAALHEVYTRLDAAGAPIERAPEEWVYSWFATAGELDLLHTREPTADAWTIRAGDAGRARVAVVVRDLRGGTAWALREVALAP